MPSGPAAWLAKDISSDLDHDRLRRSGIDDPSVGRAMSDLISLIFKMLTQGGNPGRGRKPVRERLSEDSDWYLDKNAYGHSVLRKNPASASAPLSAYQAVTELPAELSFSLS